MRYLKITLILILGLALGGLIGLGAAGLFQRLAGSIRGEIVLLIFVPWILAGVYLALLVHELGHALAGRLAGFDFVLLAAGPLVVTRKSGVTAYKLERNTRFFGGLTAGAPRHAGDLDRKLALIVAGGPFASLLFSGLCLALTRPLLALDFTTGFTALLVSVFSGLYCLYSLLPRRAGGLMSDGARLLSLWRDDGEAHRRLLMLVMQAEMMAGVRPRHLNPVAMQALIDAQDDSYTGIATGLIAYYHYLDQGQVDLAGEQLVRALEARKRLPPGFGEGVALEAAYFYAVHRGEVGKARRYLEEAQGAVAEEHTRLRAEAAVLLAQGERQAAAEAARRGIQAARSSSQPGPAQAEAEWMAQLLD